MIADALVSAVHPGSFQDVVADATQTVLIPGMTEQQEISLNMQPYYMYWP